MGAVAVGCGGNDDGPPPTLGEQACEQIAMCPDLELLVSVEQCAESLDADFADDPPGCGECFAELTCAGLLEIDRAPARLSEICPACPL